MAKDGERNEALDTRIYARAAASHFGIDRFQEQHWAALEKQMGIRAAAAFIAAVQVMTPAPQPARQERNQRSPDPFSRDDRFGVMTDAPGSPIEKAGSTDDAQKGFGELRVVNTVGSAISWHRACLASNNRSCMVSVYSVRKLLPIPLCD